MIKRIRVLTICALTCVFFLLVACGQEDPLDEMKKIVPIYEGAKVLESYSPKEKMSVIKLEVEVSKVSQKEILNFYKDAMIKQGWEFKGLKDYGKDGSVMELAKKDWGTFFVQTITKKTKKTGKIIINLSLTKK